MKYCPLKWIYIERERARGCYRGRVLSRGETVPAGSQDNAEDEIEDLYLPVYCAYCARSVSMFRPAVRIYNESTLQHGVFLFIHLLSTNSRFSSEPLFFAELYYYPNDYHALGFVFFYRGRTLKYSAFFPRSF